jgi:hypothetical protein
MTPKPPFVLTKDERDSKLWRKLMKHWEERLTSLRIQNDSDRSETDTALLRGRIAEVKANMALDKDSPAVDIAAPGNWHGKQ